MNATVPASKQTETNLIDDSLRRELRVGDPKNAEEVATALRTRYAEDAARIDQEALGFPVRPSIDTTASGADRNAPAGASETETRRADDALQADFETLIREPANRERGAELKGWREAAVDEWSAGLQAALCAQDPAQRGRTLYAIGKLSDFSRVARLAGVAYQELFRPYRRLAASLDACGNVLRVHTGEALYHARLAEGGLFTPMPVADARTRRDGLIMSVRRLTGVAPENGDWPDGLVSYRALLAAIDNEQREDLLVLLREESLAPVLNNLVAEARRLSPDALRGLAAAGMVDLTRLDELLALVARSPIPVSPPLASYVENIRLFLELFGVGAAGRAQTRVGARLVELAVPAPISVFGPYVTDAGPRQQLRSLAAWRHALAVDVEIALPPPQAPAAAARQVQGDLALYAVDRAIDHFAQGEGLAGNWGQAELHAGAYVNIVNSFLRASPPLPNLVQLAAVFDAIWAAGFPGPPRAVETQVWTDLGRRMLTWNAMVRSLSPR